MDEQAERACGVLAYGDLKRVELAVALANEPRLLLMDEPTAGMAPKERIELMALTAEIVRERRIAVLFTEHDMDVVFAHADRIIVLDRGRAHRRRASRPRSARARRCSEVYLGGGACRSATDAVGAESRRVLRPGAHPVRRRARGRRRARSSCCWAATAPASRPR